MKKKTKKVVKKAKGLNKFMQEEVKEGESKKKARKDKPGMKEEKGEITHK